jgi:two-component system response regulator HydG
MTDHARPSDSSPVLLAEPSPSLAVLAVDDDDANLELTVCMLRELGFRVLAARNGAEALHLMEASQPNIVITDLMMPEVDGAELLRRIKAANPAVPVVVMSVLDSVERAVELLKTGADDYLIKPISLEVLKARLDGLVAKLTMSRHVEELRGLVRYAFDPGRDFVLGPSNAILKVAAKIPTLARTDATVVI